MTAALVLPVLVPPAAGSAARRRARRRRARSSAEVALRLEAVSHVFHPGTASEVRALDGVDLELERGSFAVVLGTNGSGKSSLLNAMAGSLAATGGRILLDGWDVTGWPEHRRARLISRVFQNPFTGTASDLSVAENLALAAGAAAGGGSGRTLDRERRESLGEPCHPAGHGAGGPARHADRPPVGRPAPGAHRAHGHDGATHACCCSTSIPRRSTRGAPSR